MTAPAVQLRLATEADAGLMIDLEEEIFAEDPWTPHMVREELSATHRHYVIAEDPQGLALGYGGVSTFEDADIMTIGVRELARRHGVGRLILAELINAARRAHSRRVFLEVRASSYGAHELYAQAGFEQVGRIRNYFRNPQEDAITMRLMVD